MSKMIENYLLKEQVGQGQYGKVYKALDTKTQTYVAIKVVKLNKFREVPKLNEFTNNEIKTLTKIVNQNVIKFIEILQSKNNVYLVYEFCNGYFINSQIIISGTLEDLIHKSKFLQENVALTIFNQILNAFQSLVSANILHRDLKPSNILLNDGVIKVADFGFCKSLPGPQDLTKTMVGSPIYMAPEILQGKIYSIKVILFAQQNSKADIWSMGVVLFEMLFGYCPYEDKAIASLITQINQKTLKIPTNIQPISQLTETLLRYMLVVAPQQRIEWNQLLQIQPVIQKQLMQQQANQLQIQKENQQKLIKSGCQQQMQASTKQTNNQVLQPIINQLPVNTANTEAPKRITKQYSQNNLNYKPYQNSNNQQLQQQQQTKENHQQQGIQNQISTSINEAYNIPSQIDIAQVIQKNMKILSKQRQKICSGVNLLMELLSFEGHLNDDLLILIFIKFHVIYYEIEQLKQLIANGQSKSIIIAELDQKEQFFESKQFKAFQEIVQNEQKEIEKCVQIYLEEAQQYCEQSSQKELTTRLMQFSFDQHQFTNKIQYAEIINLLVKALKETGKTKNIALEDQKQFLICVNNLINYLAEANDSTMKEKILQISQFQLLEEQSKAVISNLQTLKIKININQSI